MPLTFKSEEERAKAYDEIPEIEDAPTDVDLEKWREEQEAKFDEIDSAEIVPDGTDNDGSDDSGSDDTGSDDAGSDDDTGSEDKKDKKDDGPSPAEERIKELQEERRAMMSQFDEEKQELTNRVKALEEAGVKPKEDRVEPKPSADIEKKDKEISDVRQEIDNLEKEMNKVDDYYDEDYQKGMKKQARLSLRLNNLMAEKYNLELSKNRDEIEELKTAQQKDKEELEAKQAKEEEKRQKKESRKKQVEGIDKFRGDNKEFQSKRSYDDMEKDYAEFVMELASINTGKLPNELTMQDTEIAVMRYIEQTPSLMEKLKGKHVKEPQDMREFRVLSDINALKMGLKLDQRTGKWTEVVDDNGNRVNFPSFKAAYQHYREEKGITGQELLDAERKAAQNIITAINKRADVTELNETHEKDNIDEMSKEEAMKVINEINEEEVIILARRDMKSPKVQLYNKALTTIGLDPIEEGF